MANRKGEIVGAFVRADQKGAIQEKANEQRTTASQYLRSLIDQATNREIPLQTKVPKRQRRMIGAYVDPTSKIKLEQLAAYNYRTITEEIQRMIDDATLGIRCSNCQARSWETRTLLNLSLCYSCYDTITLR